MKETDANNLNFIKGKPNYFITNIAPNGKQLRTSYQKADGTIDGYALDLPQPDFGEKDVSSFNYIANKPGINDKLIQVADSGTGMYGRGTTAYSSAKIMNLSTGFANPGNKYTAERLTGHRGISVDSGALPLNVLGHKCVLYNGATIVDSIYIPLSATMEILKDDGSAYLHNYKMYWNNTSTSWINLRYTRSLFNNGDKWSLDDGTSFHISTKQATPAELKFVIYQVLA